MKAFNPTSTRTVVVGAEITLEWKCKSFWLEVSNKDL